MISLTTRNTKFSVLLADDHKMLRDLWALIISKDDRFYISAQAANGAEAIEMARINRPDAALLDINMSPVDGFEATKGIRKFSPGTKILGISMYAFPAYAKKILAAGAKGYLTKNSPVDELITALTEVTKGETYLCEQIKTMIKAEEDELNAGKGPALTKREIQIISLIKEGLTSKEIACRLDLSLSTVDIHRYNIFKKLNIKNLAALMNFSHNHGL